MSIHVDVRTEVNAPASTVWEILDDFGNIANYTGQVKTSDLKGEALTGVGATRVCELAPFGATNETIREYVPGEKMVIELYDLSGMPISGTMSTFAVKPLDGDRSELLFTSEVEPKGGVLKGFVGRRLQSRLPAGAKSMLDDLARAAEAKVAG